MGLFLRALHAFKKSAIHLFSYTCDMSHDLIANQCIEILLRDGYVLNKSVL
jgi:hypothetical protein